MLWLGVVLIFTSRSGSVINNATECFQRKVAEWSRNYGDGQLLKLLHSYYHYMDLGMEDLAGNLVSPDGDSTIMLMMMDTDVRVRRV